ncbi:hypothetical protein KP509_19G022900 [Ceratopteris richardii]|uniref:Uncharacterized protein n=1 Tax=Ceratopteris richardii TaxID=49495 RepID=A0A8T2SKP2_CERRI|nr:hypothetical protein KP509_19G022700 [Ceratopteris richardii]KAH7351970.1 hypothetical protein KP509_19G022900 [Ceratopteris richardii]
MRRAHYKYLSARKTSLILHLIPLKVALSETLFLLSLSCRAARQRHGGAEMLQSNSLCMHYAVVDHAYHCVYPCLSLRPNDAYSLLHFPVRCYCILSIQFHVFCISRRSVCIALDILCS